MQFRLVAIVFFCVSLLGIPSAEAALKVGVVDVLKVMDAVPAWGKVVNKMKSEWQAKQSELEKKQNDLKAKKAQLEQKAVVSDPRTIAKEEAELMQAAQKLAQTFMVQQRLISAQELDLKNQMFKRIEPLVYKLAEDRDLSFVFEAGTEQQPNVLYNSKSVDLTKQVVRAYKSTYKNKSFEVRTEFPPGFGQGGPASMPQ